MMWLLFLWGFAEATLFFVVPDVPISFLATKDLKRALVGSALAVVGAVLGGAIMYVLAAHWPDQVLWVVEKVPAVSWEMIGRVERQVAEIGPLAMFVGAFSGAPYKVYASVFGARGLPAFSFIIVSIPARFTRFVVVAVVVNFLSKAVPERMRVPLLTAGWVIFYAAFWYLMPW